MPVYILLDAFISPLCENLIQQSVSTHKHKRNVPACTYVNMYGTYITVNLQLYILFICRIHVGIYIQMISSLGHILGVVVSWYFQLVLYKF